MADEVLYVVTGPKTLMEMTWEEVAEVLKVSDICLFGVAAIEEHGPHLPIGTDTFIVTEVLKATQRLLEAEGIRIVVGPTVEFGVNPGAMSYPGSITIRPDTLKALLVDYCESLYQHGFHHIGMLMGHDEDLHAMAMAAQDLVRAHPDLMVLTLNSMMASKASERASLKPRKPDGHGGAGETSRLLVTHPNLVKLDRARPSEEEERPLLREIPGGASPLFGGGVYNPLADLIRYDHAKGHPGQTGDPRLADPEIGRRAYEAKAAWIADVVKRDFLAR